MKTGIVILALLLAGTAGAQVTQDDIDRLDGRIDALEDRVCVLEGCQPDPDPDPVPDPDPSPDPDLLPIPPETIVTPRDTVPNFAAHPTVASVSSGAWFASSTWSNGVVPGENDIVWIPAGHTVTYAGGSHETIAVIGVDGALVFASDVSSHLHVGTLVVMPDGELVMGTSEDPVTAGVDVVIADWPLATDGPDAVTGVFDPHQFGTGLLGFGIITIHGDPVSPTFVRTSAEVMAGTSTVEIAEPVHGWRVGDRVLLPDTRHLDADTNRPDVFVGQWETRVLSDVSSSLEVSQPWAHSHIGARDADGVIDFLPHVGNLSRRVVIRSADNAETRGHVLFGHRAVVDVQYAAFVGLGRTREVAIDDTVMSANGTVSHIGTNQKARYALHLHHAMGPANPEPGQPQFRLHGNAVDGGDQVNDLKWGLVVHGAHFGEITDNVVYNSASGAGLVTEDGNESQNLIRGNFIVRHRTIHTDVQQVSDAQVRDGLGGWGYWGAGPLNTITDNVVANASFSAYFVMGRGVVKVPDTPGQMATRDVNLRHSTFVEFARNEAYAAMRRGVDIWDFGDRYSVRGNPSSPEVVVTDTVVWHVHGVGIGPYYIGRVIIDKWTQRGHPDSMAARTDQMHLQLGIGASGALNVETFVRNADIQNMQFGIIQRGRGFFRLLEAQNVILRNRVNFMMRPFAGPDEGVDVVLRGVTFGEVDNWPARHIEMSWTPALPVIVLRRQQLTIENYQGTGRDVDVFWTTQAPDAPLGFLRPENIPPDVHPEPFLTNQESWDRYGLTTAGVLATCQDGDVGVIGYVCDR